MTPAAPPIDATAPGLALTPDGRLVPVSGRGAGSRAGSPAGDESRPAASAWLDAFAGDWREGLFTLAARGVPPEGCASVRFWKSIADTYLTRLCHVPASAPRIEVPLPTRDQLDAWTDAAPPMRGGEYLAPNTLVQVWVSLDEWVLAAVDDAGGLEAFLAERAPDWHQVGDVCFHLAEHRDDPDRPFAFLVTTTTGLSAAGRPRHVPLRDALTQHAEAGDRQALVRLLEPVERAAAACPWVAELVEQNRLAVPSVWTPEQAHELLQSVPTLEACGLAVRIPDWWQRRPRARVAVTIGEDDRTTLGASALLDFDVGVALGEESLTEAEIEELLEGDDGLVLVRGRWVELDRDRLRQALDHWRELEDRAGRGEIGFVEGMRLLAGAPADLGARVDVDEEAEVRAWTHVAAGAGLRRLLEDLRHPDRRVTDEPPGLEATLRPYQREGVAWLDLLTGLGLGACLADDMGLGKTVQVLALLLHRRAAANAAKKPRTGRKRRNGRTGPNGGPSLLVVPASLLGNWRHEAARFAPSLRLAFLHPSECDARTLAEIAADPATHLADADLAVTTYSMLARQPWLEEVRWQLVILDEAQAIKNPATRQSRAARALPAVARIALTGTPIENQVGDLWSLFDFLNPGLLGSASRFTAFVRDLESREDDRYGPLRRLTAPYILRRMKTDRAIIDDLPEKAVVRQACTLTPRQARDYRGIVDRLGRRLAEVDGIARRGAVLEAMMRLKQVCNHPSHLRGDDAYEPSASGKFIRLREICGELAERQERALVFTQFREVIDPLAAFLAGVFGREGLVLHGGTSVARRRGLVERFQAEDGPPFMVLSLKAGGTGLNLTAASHVIHFDRWWNPAVEDQATDRAFRIGQRQNVLVHTFVVEGTVEERIDEMIREKRGVAAGVLGGGGELNLTELSDEALMDLVRLDVTRAR